MQTSFTLDYISATSKTHSLRDVIKRFSFGLQADEWITAKAHNGYEHALKHPYGHVVSWTNKRDDMGVHVLFSGMPLKELHDLGENTLTLVYWLYEEEFKFARLDFAIDVRGVWFDLEELQRSKFTGSVNKLPILIKDGPNAEEGQTLYIGSWESDKFIRIYDKGVLQKPQEINWFRFELVVKSKTATKFAKLIYNLPDSEVGKKAQGVMIAMFTPEHENYRQAMDAEPVKVSSTKDTEHGTYDWLMSSVSKTLARVILELPHRDVERTFMLEVQKHIREIAARSLTKTDEL